MTVYLAYSRAAGRGFLFAGEESLKWGRSLFSFGTEEDLIVVDELQNLCAREGFFRCVGDSEIVLTLMRENYRRVSSPLQWRDRRQVGLGFELWLRHVGYGPLNVLLSRYDPMGAKVTSQLKRRLLSSLEVDSMSTFPYRAVGVHAFWSSVLSAGGSSGW